MSEKSNKMTVKPTKAGRFYKDKDGNILSNSSEKSDVSDIKPEVIKHVSKG